VNATPPATSGQRCCFFPYTNSTKPMPLGMSDKNSQVGSKFTNVVDLERLEDRDHLDERAFQQRHRGE
jgi:hypothetical protein